MAVKAKTHKATSKRFKRTAGGKGKVMHLPQGAGNGHSRNFMNRRQRKSKSGTNALQSNKQVKTITRLLNQ